MPIRAVLFDLGNTLVAYYRTAEFPKVLRLCLFNATKAVGMSLSAKHTAAETANAMTVSSQHYVEFVKEQLAGVPEVNSRRFFGGIGLSSGGVQFVMIMGSCLYFVVDTVTRARYERWAAAASATRPRGDASTSKNITRCPE